MDSDDFITQQFLLAIAGGAQAIEAFMTRYFPGITPAEALACITQANESAADLSAFDAIASVAWENWQE